MGPQGFRVLEGNGDYTDSNGECWDVDYASGRVFPDLDAAQRFAEEHYAQMTADIAAGPNGQWWKSFWCAVVPSGLTEQAAIVFVRSQEKGISNGESV